MRRMYSKPQLLETVEQEAKTNGIKVFEDIKDKEEHNRFIEGDITLEEISGVEKTYGKWALSGSHLLIVLGGNIDDAIVLSSQTMCKINVPQWIKDKIVPLLSTVVATNTSLAYNTLDASTQELNAILRKDSSDIYITVGYFSATKSRTFRISFDLLIDNE